jgi:hypothetical protein
MQRFIKYQSIEQFRHITKQIQEHACYIGRDADNQPIFDYLKPKPTLTFLATEKIHGTNAAVCYSIPDGMWAQSRERILSMESDNMGFCFFAMQKEQQLINLIIDLAHEHLIDLTTHIISLYGEWAGGSIQKNSALSGIDKTFIIFQYFKVSPIEPSENEETVWYPTTTSIDVYDENTAEHIGIKYIGAENTEHRILNITNFPVYQFTIDFNDPNKYINDIIQLVEETIEPNSPVGRQLGQDNNIGEGLVCSHLSDTGELYQFKVKGEKHSNSPVKTTTPVDIEKMNKLDECAAKICHNWRFEQALTAVFGYNYEQTLSRDKLGQYLKWVADDTIKEEADIIAEFGFEPKDVMGRVQTKAKNFFFAVENNA